MPRIAFATDLHGHPKRYQALFHQMEQNPPDMLLLGGDLMPHGFTGLNGDFLSDTFLQGFAKLREQLGEQYPRVYLILGNDDGKSVEPWFVEQAEETGLWAYLHGKVIEDSGLTLIGYSYVPPSPFMLKDWEKYDVSRFTDPGCVSPEEGRHSFPVNMNEVRYATIAKDIEELTSDVEMENAVLISHSPPYQTLLDRAGLDGQMIDHVPLDVHVGSIAISRWIQDRQPLLTLHGHIHESTRRTGEWRQQMGRTWMMNGASNQAQACLLEMESDDLESATRTLYATTTDY
jgi:uncharacterized protein